MSHITKLSMREGLAPTSLPPHCEEKIPKVAALHAPDCILELFYCCL